MLRCLLIVSYIVGGVSCFSFNGQKTVEAKRGENVDIRWTLNGLNNASDILLFRIYLKEIKRAKRIRVNGDKYNIDAGFSLPEPPLLPLSQRTTATYTYDAATQTGIVNFTITKLEINDSNKYILEDFISQKIFTTTLYVQVEPERCGTPLKPSYIVNGTESLNIVLGVCGKPQPVVKCQLGSGDNIDFSSTEIGQHNYSYTANITTNLQPCETKKLVCTATGFGEDFEQTASVTANFFSSEKQFIEELQFVKQPDTDSIQVSWVMKVNTGSCDVHYQLNYLNETNSTIATNKVNNESIVNNDGTLVYTNETFSNQEAVKVKVVTKISGKINGYEEVLGTRTSLVVAFRENIVTTVPPKITPAQTTPAKTIHAQATPPKTTPAPSSSSEPIAVYVIIGVVVIMVICFIAIFWFKKRNRRKSDAILLEEDVEANSMDEVNVFPTRRQENIYSHTYAPVNQNSHEHPRDNQYESTQGASYETPHSNLHEPPAGNSYEYSNLYEPSNVASYKPVPHNSRMEYTNNDYDVVASPQEAEPPKDLSGMYAKVDMTKKAADKKKAAEGNKAAEAKKTTTYTALAPGSPTGSGGHEGPNGFKFPTRQQENIHSSGYAPVNQSSHELPRDNSYESPQGPSYEAPHGNLHKPPAGNSYESSEINPYEPLNVPSYKPVPYNSRMGYTDNDYDVVASPQETEPPKDLSEMYAKVDKTKKAANKNKAAEENEAVEAKNTTMYTALAPGGPTGPGGRKGPKPVVRKSNYATAKDFTPKPFPDEGYIEDNNSDSEDFIDMKKILLVQREERQDDDDVS